MAASEKEGERERERGRGGVPSLGGVLVPRSNLACQTQRGLMTYDLMGKAGTIARLMNSDKVGM